MVKSSSSLQTDWQIVLNTGFFLVISTLAVVLLVCKFLRNPLDKVIKRPSQPSKTRRRLGKLEACLDQISRERRGAINLCLIFSLKSKTKLLKEHVRKALLVLAKRQPLLRAVMTSIPSWSTLAKDRHLEIIDGNKITGMIKLTSVEVKAREWPSVWHEITTKQLGSGLLWQVVTLQEEFLPETENYINTLIFKMNHVCCDGVSSIKLCKQFLRYLNGVAQGSLTSDENIPSLSLLPNLCDLVERERPWSLRNFVAECLGIPHISKLIFKSKVRHLLSSKQCNPFFDRFPPNKDMSTSSRSNLLYKVFSESETSKIVKSCRSNKSSVTGALMAAIHMAFCELIQNGNFSTNDLQLEQEFAINAQRNCHPKPPEDYIGQFAVVQSLSMKYTAEEADFWDLARETTERLHHEVKAAKHITHNMAILDSFSAEEYVDEIFCPSDRQNLIRQSSCNGVSSAGSFEFGEEQKHYTYQLHECLYNSLVHGTTITFFHFNVTVNGKMSWVILHDPSTVKQSEAETFSKLCFNYFLDIEHLEKKGF